MAKKIFLILGLILSTAFLYQNCAETGGVTPISTCEPFCEEGGDDGGFDRQTGEVSVTIINAEFDSSRRNLDVRFDYRRGNFSNVSISYNLSENSMVKANGPINVNGAPEGNRSAIIPLGFTAAPNVIYTLRLNIRGLEGFDSSFDASELNFGVQQSFPAEQVQERNNINYGSNPTDIDLFEILRQSNIQPHQEFYIDMEIEVGNVRELPSGSSSTVEVDTLFSLRNAMGEEYVSAFIYESPTQGSNFSYFYGIALESRNIAFTSSLREINEDPWTSGNVLRLQFVFRSTWYDATLFGRPLAYWRIEDPETDYLAFVQLPAPDNLSSFSPYNAFGFEGLSLRLGREGTNTLSGVILRHPQGGWRVRSLRAVACGYDVSQSVARPDSCSGLP